MKESFVITLLDMKLDLRYIRTTKMNNCNCKYVFFFFSVKLPYYPYHTISPKTASHKFS